MSDFFGYVGFVVLLGLLLIGFALAVGGLLRGRILRIQNVLTRHARRATWVGALNLGFGVAVSLPFFALQAATGSDGWALPGLGLLALLVVAVAVGFAGLSLWAGTRLLPDHALPARLAMGAGAVALGAGLPIAGTFLLLPLALCLSLGGLILSFLLRVSEPGPALN